MTESALDALMPVRLPDAVIAALEARFRLHRYWEIDDKPGFLAGVAPHIRAIATAAAILSEGPPLRIDAEFMARFPRLEIVANLGVGYDNIDAEWAGQHGIVVTNTPDVLTDEVADLAMALLLATVREVPQADAYLRKGGWKSHPYRLTATLRGRSLGILGLGRIGKAIAERAAPFGLRIAYHGRTRQADVPFAYYPTVAALAQASDILMIVAPGGPQTRRIVNAETLRALGPDGILINVARGSLVDEAALVEALKSRTLFAAGLDVFENEPHVPEELVKMDNVVLLPHVGSGSHHARRAMGQLVVDNIVSWAAGEGPLTPVAETPWPRRKDARPSSKKRGEA